MKSDKLEYYGAQAGGDFLGVSRQCIENRVKKGLLLADAYLIAKKGLCPLFTKQTLLNQPSNGFLRGRKSKKEENL